MNEIKFIPVEDGNKAFVIEENNERIAEMVVGIIGNKMSVYHTEVADQLEGQGIGKKLIQEMVDYARNNNLKVLPLCPYVLAQFKRHPDQFSDIWEKE